MNEEYSGVVKSFRFPLGICITKTNDTVGTRHIINRRYDPNIVIPYSVSPSDIASCLSYQELSDKLLIKYNMKSSMNKNGDIEFR